MDGKLQNNKIYKNKPEKYTREYSKELNKYVFYIKKNNKIGLNNETKYKNTERKTVISSN